MTTKTLDIILVPEEKNNIACNGNDQSSHPKVYYTFDGQEKITCKYCDRTFTKTSCDGAVPYAG